MDGGEVGAEDFSGVEKVRDVGFGIFLGDCSSGKWIEDAVISTVLLAF